MIPVTTPSKKPRLLFVEAVQYGGYYDDRYAHVAALGYDVHVLYGEGRPHERRPDPAPHRGEPRPAAARDRRAGLARPGAVRRHRDPRRAVGARDGGAGRAAGPALRLARPPRSPRATSTPCAAPIWRGGAPHPDFIGVDALADLAAWPRDAFPAIVKPAMGSASSFVFKASTPEELAARTALVLENASRMAVATLEATGIPRSGPAAIVERFLDGSEHLVEGYVHAGRFVLGSLVDRITVEGDTFDDDVHHAPSRLAPSIVEAVTACVQAAVTAQGVESAPIHAEVRFHDGAPFIVEVAVRPGGGGLNRMAEISYGYDPLRVVAELALGRDPAHRHAGPLGVHTVAACVIGPEGVVRAIRGEERLGAREDVFFLKLVARPGTELLRPPRGNSIVGFLGVTGATEEAALGTLNAVSAMLTIEMEDLRHAS
jgi:hypothetical protein